MSLNLYSLHMYCVYHGHKQRFHTSYTTLYNAIISHGALIGMFYFLPKRPLILPCIMLLWAQNRGMTSCRQRNQKWTQPTCIHIWTCCETTLGKLKSLHPSGVTCLWTWIAMSLLHNIHLNKTTNFLHRDLFFKLGSYKASCFEWIIVHRSLPFWVYSWWKRTPNPDFIWMLRTSWQVLPPFHIVWLLLIIYLYKPSDIIFIPYWSGMFLDKFKCHLEYAVDEVIWMDCVIV